MEDTTSRKEEAIERFKRLSDNCEERCRRIQEVTDQFSQQQLIVNNISIEIDLLRLSA